MQLYLSSYRLGKNPEDFAAYFVHNNKRVAVIVNAVDSGSMEERRTRVEAEVQMLTALGLEPEEIDLRDYFDDPEALRHRLNQFGGVWVRGGNTFVLRRAMAQSGMDSYLESKVKDKSFIYGGYSAGICVLAPDLHGLDLVDDPHEVPAGYQKEIIWEGLAILDYLIVPHYKSDHPESAMAEKTVEYLLKHTIEHKTLRDGEVIVGETV